MKQLLQMSKKNQKNYSDRDFNHRIISAAIGAGPGRVKM